MAVNKVVYGGETVIDLSGDTVTADSLVTGTKAHDKSGASIIGTNPYAKAETDRAVAAIGVAIADKGVSVPDGTTLDGMAALIESIEAGGDVQPAGGTDRVTGTFTTSDAVLSTITINGLGFTPKHVDVFFGDLSNAAGGRSKGTNSGTRYYLLGISCGFNYNVMLAKTGDSTATVWRYGGYNYGAVGIGMSITTDGFTITNTSSTKYTYSGKYTYCAYK